MAEGKKASRFWPIYQGGKPFDEAKICAALQIVIPGAVG